MAIGEKWSEFAASWVGDAQGRHCHWCKHIELGDGEAWCNEPGAIYGDGERIRTWDGEGAKECPKFKLKAFYEDDANLESIANGGKP